MTQEIELGSIGFTDKHEWVSGYSQVIDGTDTPGYSVNDVVHTTNGVWCSKVDNNIYNPDEDADHTYWDPWMDVTEVNQKAKLVVESVDSITTMKTQIASLEVLHDPTKFAVAAWNNDDLSPNAIEFQGDKSVVDDYKFMLIDTTDNAGPTVNWKELKRNNLLRFTDDSYAPTVGIKQTMYDECMTHDLYVLADDSTYTKVYDSGAYDASAEWDIDKPLIQAGGEARILYITDGSTYTAVSHKLRPWETTETKYTIGLGMDHDVYLLDNVKGKSGKTWQGLFLGPAIWDGIDLTDFKLAPTAISPSPVCTVGGKTRSFFYLYEGETNCKGKTYQGCSMFNEGRTYPRVEDMQQVNNMNFARANNADTTLPYPFAEGGYHALNTYNVALEVLYETRYIHGASKFGTGISSNDSCSDEVTWLANGGFRAKAQGTGTWSYAAWNGNTIIYTANNGSSKLLATNINYEYPKEQVMESQMAFSYAMELGVAEGDKFDFYGGKYWYKVVPETTGVEKMNVRVYRIKTGTASGYNSSGTATTFDVEACLRMSLFGGANLSGDIFAYWGGGYEQVGTCINTANDAAGHPVDLYIQPNQKEWARETVITKDNLGKFDFEKSYLFIGNYTSVSDGYAKSRAPYTGWKIANGGSSANGMCFYVWSNKYWSSVLNQRARIAVRFRGSARHSFCSRRSLLAYFAASYAVRALAGSAQVLIAAGPRRGIPQG